MNTIFFTPFFLTETRAVVVLVEFLMRNLDRQFINPSISLFLLKLDFLALLMQWVVLIYVNTCNQWRTVIGQN